MSLSLQQAFHLPAPGDNVAIASRRLEAGHRVELPGQIVTLRHTIPEGHRLAVGHMAVGDRLLSWGLPFGLALRSIQPGDYICNRTILEVLQRRHVDFALPTEPNFQDYSQPFHFDKARFRPADQLPVLDDGAVFDGFWRGSERGAGTRNYIAVLGTTSRAAGYARSLAERFRGVAARFPNLDGVVALAHTEGGGETLPSNLEFLLRTLAGCVVHPNIGAILIAETGSPKVTNAMLQGFLAKNHYPLHDVLHRFLTTEGSFESALAQGQTIVESWLEVVAGTQRTPQPLAHLKVALQCGGSDAFSGVSGNPLAGWVAREVVRHGGSANLAETDELIGAESYILEKVKDAATAEKFLAQIARFEERVGWHGLSAASNPSGGNLFRGLYNLPIKSIGAARKKDPAVRLDAVIDYAERMSDPGFYFMDSPGNDLESVAGQVAAGCNAILFTTGNGSITNFPFVPTIKIMTNTGRFQLLRHEMDLNAGRCLEGTSLDELGREAFDYTLRVASGARSAGEKAGHSQIQIWREWRLTGPEDLARVKTLPRPSRQPLRLKEIVSAPILEIPFSFTAFRTPRGVAADRVGLIAATSLCSGQVAKLIAERLNKSLAPRLSPAEGGLRRFLALAHTEGCGVSGDEAQELLQRTLVGYLRHPSVEAGLLLEHGCEKTHQDAMRDFLQRHGLDAQQFGWASVQLDGGIEKVAAKVEEWFKKRMTACSTTTQVEAGLADVSVGVLSAGILPPAAARSVSQLVRLVAAAGGTVIIPQNGALLPHPILQAELLDAPVVPPTIASGERPTAKGFHVMENPTDHYVETLTGLGATGVQVILAFSTHGPLQAHPLIPVLQLGSLPHPDFDLVIEWDKINAVAAANQWLLWIRRVLAGEYTPKLFQGGNTDFQMTRGFHGVST